MEFLQCKIFSFYSSITVDTIKSLEYFKDDKFTCLVFLSIARLKRFGPLNLQFNFHVEAPIVEISKLYGISIECPLLVHEDPVLPNAVCNLSK